MAQLPLIMFGRLPVFKKHPALGNVRFTYLKYNLPHLLTDWSRLALLLAGPAERVPPPRRRASFRLLPLTPRSTLTKLLVISYIRY